MNNFGGDWTESKIEILVEYAKAYLTIMNIYAHRYDWKLLYFDGFAGSGSIKKGNEQDEFFAVWPYDVTWQNKEWLTHFLRAHTKARDGSSNNNVVQDHQRTSARPVRRRASGVMCCSRSVVRS